MLLEHVQYELTEKKDNFQYNDCNICCHFCSQHFRLEFQEFDVEYHTSCVWDYVEILENYNDGEQEAHKLGRFCGQDKLLPIQTSSNNMTIIFHSDHVIPKKGFKLYIDTVGKFYHFRDLLFY